MYSQLTRRLVTTPKTPLMARAMSVQVKHTNLFINNEYVPSLSGRTFETFNPATEEKIADVASAMPEDIDLAVAAAREAFDNGPWRRMDPADRGRIIYKLADLIEQNKDELIALEALDNGKTASLASTLDVPTVVNYLRYFAGWTDKITGETIPISGPYLAYTKMEPVGVCAQIIPFNFPLIMAGMKLGPALASGNTVVLKPAEQTPLTALRLGEFVVEAGFPKGVVNIVSGLGATAGSHLTKHADVDKIAFTGSTRVGMELMRSSHEHNLKRMTLELGGKSANIILDDADMDLAIAQSQFGLFVNNGQACIAGSRVFVQEGIYDEFVRRTAEAANTAVVGDPFDPKSTQGAIISRAQFDKVLGYIEAGKQDGARLVAGGKRVGDRGFFIEQTVFADVTDDMKIAREEIFGPVMSILKFKTIDEVIERANATAYGLAAGVVTSSVDNAIKLSNGLQAGNVYVNCYSKIDATAPFGGFKDSGIGRELGKSGLAAYLESKTVIIKRPDDSLP